MDIVYLKVRPKAEDKFRVIPMTVIPSKDPCVYNTATGEFEMDKLPADKDEHDPR